MLSALYLPEILVGGDKVRKGKKTRECLVTPEKTHTRIRTKDKYQISAAGGNTRRVPGNQNKEDKEQPEDFSRSPVETSSRIRDTKR